MTQPIIQVVRVKPEGSTQTVNELKRVRSELKGVADDAKAANQSGGGGGLSVARSAVGAAGGALATVGGSAAGGAVGSILNLTAVLGPLGAVAGIVTVGVGALTAALQESEQAHEARLDTERAIAREIGSLTSEQAAEKLRAAEEQLRIDQEIARQQLANAALYNIEISTQPLKLAAALAGADPLYNAYNNAIAENNVALEEGETRVELYRRAIEEGATAAADAEAAQKELNALYRELDQVYLDSASSALAADKLTSEQRQARIAEIDAEIASYQALIDSGNLHEETITELEAKISKLSVVQEAYKNVVQSTADQLARVERANTAYNDFVEQSLDAADAVTKAGETVTKTQQELADLEAATAAKQREIEAKHAEELADIEAEGAEERAKIVSDAADEIRRIERDLARSQKDAVRRRDVVASIQAREQAADALEDQKRSDDKQLATQEQAQRKQLASLQRAKQQELASVAEASNRELGIKRQALVNALNDLDSAKRSEQFLATAGKNALLSIEESFWKERIVLAQKYSTASPTVFPTLTESIANGTVGQPAQGGVTVNVNNPGASSRQVGETVRRTLQQVWRD